MKNFEFFHTELLDFCVNFTKLLYIMRVVLACGNIIPIAELGLKKLSLIKLLI